MQKNNYYVTEDGEKHILKYWESIPNTIKPKWWGIIFNFK